MLSRRAFVQGSLAAAAGAALPFQNVGRALALTPAPPLTPFVDALPIPPLKSPVTPNTYQLSVQPISHSYHSSLPATPMWGYDGMYPGPTFVANRGTFITVQVNNNLTAGSHPFAAAMDDTIPGNVDDGRIAVHLHGGESSPNSDGNPMSLILPGQSLNYVYGNGQRGTTLWYHDHAFGNTRLNVMAGLAGFYLLIDPAEEASIVANNPGAGLPTLPYLIGLALQDRDFFSDGSVDYPLVPDPGGGHFHWVPEYFGNTACVNGKATPFLAVEPRRYRFKLLNGAQARFFNLSLSNGAPITVIGSDGGYLAAPVSQSSILIAPGERYDVVIDFTGLASGTNIVMSNNAVAPFPSGTLFTDGRPDTTMNVMQFRVNVPLSGVPNPPLPATLGDVAPVVVPASTPVRSLFLNEVASQSDVVERVMLNNTGSLVGSTENPQVGATEVWEIANTTADTHPIHLHLVQYRMIDRRAFRADEYRLLALGRGYEPPVAPFITNGPTMMGHAPRPQEAAWKDTLLMHPGEVTRILVKIAPQDTTAVPGVNPYAFDPTADPGYVWHCHILEHEENDMMRPLMVSSTFAGAATSITIARNVARVGLRKPFILSGLLTPGKIGDGVVVEVMKPGSARWSYSSLRLASTQAAGAVPAGWWYRYLPTQRGLYSFRARFAGDAARTGSVSSVVTVRVV